MSNMDLNLPTTRLVSRLVSIFLASLLISSFATAHELSVCKDIYQQVEGLSMALQRKLSSSDFDSQIETLSRLNVHMYLFYRCHMEAHYVDHHGGNKTEFEEVFRDWDEHWNLELAPGAKYGF